LQTCRTISSPILQTDSLPDPAEYIIASVWWIAEWWGVAERWDKR
jgi:hypothetical protein